MTQGRSSRYGQAVAYRALLVAAPILLMPLGFAYAADAGAESSAKAEADSGLRVQEVIVTSRKRAESVQKVPIAITALTTQLQTPDVRDVRDLVAYIPNVRIEAFAQRANAANITIRGVSPTRSDDNSLDSPIGVLIDGVYLGSLPGQIIQNFDLDRVEVLRGPQGTLFGRNTVGGALNVFRTEPTGEWGAKVQYTTGSWNDQEFRGVFNAPIIKDVLAVKLFLTTENRDGYLHNTFLNINQPQKDYKNYGLALKFTPNDKFKAVLTVEQFDDRSQGGNFLGNYNFCPGVHAAPGTDPAHINDVNDSTGLLGAFLPGVFGTGANLPCRTSTAIPTSTSTSLSNPGKVLTEAYTLNMSHKLSDRLKLVSVTGYRTQHEQTYFDFDGTSTDFITINTDAHYHQFSQEVRLEGDWDSGLGKVNFVVGGYYFNSYFTRGWTTGGDFWTFVNALSGYSLAKDVWNSPTLAGATGYADPVSACLDPVRDPTPVAAGGIPTPAQSRFSVFGRTKCDPGASGAYGPGVLQKLYEKQGTDSYAAFAHADWQFYSNFTLTAGLRYTYETKHFLGYQGYLAPKARADAFAFPGAPADLNNSYENVSPAAGISYQINSDVLAYFSFTEGWHSGGFFGVNQNTDDFKSNQYKAETSQAYEFGLKGQYFDHRLQLNVAAFRSDFANKQESAVALDPLTNTVVTIFTNVGGVRYQGVEAEAQWIVTRQLKVSGSLGYLDANYTSLQIGYPNAVNANVPKVQDAAKLLRPRNAPDLTLGGEATYTVEAGPGTLEASTRVNWVDDLFTGLYNESYSRIEAHADLSLAVSYAYKNYKITAFGRNLTDHIDETPTYIAPLFAASTITPGRSWGLELQAKF